MPGASSGDVRAGGAFVEISGDDSKLAQVLASAQSKVREFADFVSTAGKRMIVGGAALQAPLILATKKFAEMANAVEEGSTRLGITTQDYSKMAYAAKMAGLAGGGVVERTGLVTPPAGGYRGSAVSIGGGHSWNF